MTAIALKWGRSWKQGATQAGESWNRFWFESNHPKQLACLRSALGFTLLVYYVTRTPDVIFYYSNQGIFPLALLQEISPVWPTIFTVFTSDAAILVSHFVFLGALLCLAFGWFSRAAAIVAFVLHVSFMHRNMATSYGVDFISTFYLLYLCFADYQRKHGDHLSTVLSSIAFRLMQIQVCIIYTYSGLGKLRGTHWWSGEAVWDVLANPQLARWDFSWVANFPVSVMWATYLTLFWEVYFGVLIWQPRFRRIFLIFGAMFHLGIGITINIPFFGFMMMVTYFVFLKDEEIQAVQAFFRRRIASIKNT
jgi:uncharacterized membrane protein YphA (DoxX/SURF4 family)